jgi:hypothetical protein
MADLKDTTAKSGPQSVYSPPRVIRLSDVNDGIGYCSDGSSTIGGYCSIGTSATGAGYCTAGNTAGAYCTSDGNSPGTACTTSGNSPH